jgi:hypothetical protein
MEMEAARQAHYIKWADILGIPDPCGSYPGYQRILAIYIKYVQCSININNIKTLRSAMVKGYAESVNALFRLRNMPAPADLSDPNPQQHVCNADQQYVTRRADSEAMRPPG